MCAVVGAIINKATIEDIDRLKMVLLQSSIRGLHATGISYIKGGKINTVIESLSVEDFLKKHSNLLYNAVNEDDNLYMIAHCRYSTSDLEFNQPLFNDNFSIVHNGVVSQELPEKWKSLYGYDCNTRNDSELILHTIEADKSPLVEFPDSSMAVVELHADKKIRFYRNGKRPIYFTSTPTSYIITSTRDIANRAGLHNIIDVPMNTYLTVGEDMIAKYDAVFIDKATDLQP